MTANRSNPIHVEGLKTTIKRLDGIGIQARDLRPVWNKIMKPIYQESLEGQPIRTGFYQRSIRVFSRNYSTGLYVRVNRKRMRYDRMVYYGGGRGHANKPYNRSFHKLIRKNEPYVLAEIDKWLSKVVRDSGIR